MFKKFSKGVVASILLLTLLSIIPLSKLRFGFNLEKLYPIGDPDRAFLETFKKRFHTEIDDEYIFIGLKNDRGIFDKGFLQKVDSLSRFLSSLDHILRVYSVTHTGYVYVKDHELHEGPIIHIAQQELYRQDSIDLFRSEGYRSLLVSKDGKSVAITAFNTPNLSDQEKDKILGAIRAQIDKLNFDEAHVTAKIRIERKYVNEIRKNLEVYLIIAFLLSGTVLFLVFRSFKGTMIPILTTIISICLTLALIALAGYPVDIISSLIPPVLAVICMSNVVHISTKYIEELRNGLPRIQAIKQTFKDIGLATFFTSLTTAVGFYTLCISNISPIRLFGFFAGTGVLIAYLVAAGFVLGIYANSQKPGIVNIEYLNQRWVRLLSFSLRGLIRNKYKVIGACFIVVLLSAYYMNKIQVNSSLLQEIPRNDPILKDYKFIEDHFAGTRPFEMALILKDTNNVFLNLPILHQIDTVENFLKDSCGVGFLISPISFIKGANQAFKGGGANNYKLPDSQRDVYYFFNQILFTGWGKDLVRFLTPDGKHARISGKLPDLTTAEFKALSEKFDQFFKTKGKAFDFTYKMTGSAILIDKISYSLVHNMFVGLFIAFCVISLIAALAFRSISMVVIVLIPNVIPLILMAAVMGMTGIYLKADTSVIFAVAFGIVVDDTIHYVSRFKLELAKGKTVAYSVKRAYLSTGKAMIITTLILLAGFMSLLFSSFTGTFYIGFLVSLCLAVALVCDLTILPLLILLFYRKK